MAVPFRARAWAGKKDSKELAKVELISPGVHTPTDQPHVERSHQTLRAQAMAGKQFKNWDQLFEHLRKRRHFINQEYPSASLGKKAPFEVFPQARHSQRHYHPSQEEQLMNMQSVFEYLARGQWFREVGSNRTVSLGGHSYYITNAKRKDQLRIKFDPETQMLYFYDPKERLLDTRPIKEMNKQKLMGTKSPEEKLINMQLKIPFNPNLLKHNVQTRLFDTL